MKKETTQAIRAFYGSPDRWAPFRLDPMRDEHERRRMLNAEGSRARGVKAQLLRSVDLDRPVR